MDRPGCGYDCAGDGDNQRGVCFAVNGKAYTVRCAGKAIKTFRTEERAEAFENAIIEDPKLFLSVQEWNPGVYYCFVDFEEEEPGESGIESSE